METEDVVTHVCGRRVVDVVDEWRMLDRWWTSEPVDREYIVTELDARGIVVLGSGADEAPEVYKDLRTVLAAHSNIDILHLLSPVGVVMAGSNDFDPYKD